MKKLLPGIGLFVATLTAIAIFPRLSANAPPVVPIAVTPINEQPVVDPKIASQAAIEVVFVLDTTSSMSGLIQTAKEKIWSIATTMTSAQQNPDIKIGLVAFRDRGDAYVTKTIDLSDDIDSVYASLMDFQAQGGGDGPESVNQGLYDAVNKLSWSQNPNSYRTIFLVGDAPPHMDYQNDVKYTETIAKASDKGIIVNTIQCGQDAGTTKIWKTIAHSGGGRYFHVEQSGGALAVSTPFDKQLAKLSAKLDDTRLYFGNAAERNRMDKKKAATSRLHSESSFASRARRSVFNSSASGRKNSLGENELVDAVSSGRVDLDELEQDELPTELQDMNVSAQVEKIQSLAESRKDLRKKIRQLSEKRESYINKEVAKSAEPSAESLDNKLYEAVRAQGARVGLKYDSGPKY